MSTPTPIDQARPEHSRKCNAVVGYVSGGDSGAPVNCNGRGFAFIDAPDRHNVGQTRRYLQICRSCGGTGRS